MTYLPDVLRFLESLGITTHIALDEQLVIEYEREINVFDVCNEIGKHQEAVKAALINRAQYERFRFYGGPLNGKPHGLGTSRSFAYRVGRANWAAYAILKDGRALFRGFASSEAKAKTVAQVARIRMEVTPPPAGR